MSDSIFLLVSNVNSTVCLCLGWPANFLLIWLIRNRTVQAMQVWSRVLFQAALVDLLLISVTFLVQPVITNDGKTLFCFLIGPFGQSNNFLTTLLLTHLNLFCIEFAKHAMAVQFLYRWLVICRERKLSLWHYTLFLTIPATMAFVEITAMMLNLFHNYIHEPHCTICPPQNHTYVMALALENTSTNFVNFLMLFCMATTYAVITATTVHIWLRSRHSLMPQQQQSREIRRQVGYVLLMQALLPLAFSLMPAIMLYLQVSFGSHHQQWVSLLYTQCWPSVLYPLATVLIVGPYRRWLLGLFHGIFVDERGISVVNPTDRQIVAAITVGSRKNHEGQIRVQ